MVIPSSPAVNRQSNVEALEQSVKDVDQQILKDKQFPNLEEQLQIGFSGQTSFSGVNDFDYPPLTGGNDIGLSCLEKQLASVKRIPLPDELIEQFQYMQCNCVMGIFPEISRSWLAIDSDLYFWVYEDGSDIAYYDGLKEIILAAGLIKPKPGIFQEHIQYLLCVTTPTNVHLLGVTFTDNQTGCHGDSFGKMHLHPEPLFTVSSDNVYITSISSTSTGRIFLAGKDGCLYELIYQAKNTWFSQKCYKVNHSSNKLAFLMPSFITNVLSADDSVIQLAIDNTRGILYNRTSKGNIQLFDLGEDMTGMNLVAGITETTIAYQAHCSAARTIDKRNFEKIIHIAPIPKSDSNLVHLVAISETGARLYFTSTSLAYPESRPSQLKLVHVRMPPGYAPSSITEKPGQVHTAYYRQGLTLLTGSLSEDTDALWCFSQDTYPFRTPIKETQASVRIDGRTWCLSEIVNPNTKGPMHLFNNTIPDPPAIQLQHILPSRKFVLLSAQGSHIITTLRPLEQLKLILTSGQTGESDSVASFFKLYGEEQACATCLTLVCNSSEAEHEIAILATQAFFRFGGDTLTASQVSVASGIANRPDLITSTVFRGLDVAPSPRIAYSPIQAGSSQGSFLATPIPAGATQLRTPAQPAFESTMLSPVAPAPATIPATVGNIKQGGKYQGLHLYFSRIVSPLWDKPMAHELQHGNLVQINSRMSCTELSWFLEQLHKLRQFMEEHMTVPDVGSPSMHTYNLIPNQTSVAYQEKPILLSVHRLVVLTIEALELWRVLTDHQFNVVVGDAPQDIRDKIKFSSFKELFSPAGIELSSSLITLLMSKYLHDNAAIDTINEQLREICPTIYSADDALYTKANEVLLGASILNNQFEKEKMLHEALMVYTKIPELIDLNWICCQLQNNQYYTGIVELCLQIALKRDPQGIALNFFKSGEPRGDVDGIEAMNIRRECYNCILSSLDYLLVNTIACPVPAPSLPTRPGPPAPTTEQVPGILPDVAMKRFSEMLDAAHQSGDELFHVGLYDWMILNKLTEKLMEIKTPFIEKYLISRVNKQVPNNRATLDILWKFYEKRTNYINAAKILMQLAEKDVLSMTIHDRLEYLSRAMISAKSCSIATSSGIEGEFLHEIEEKLDVARIQLKVYEQLLRVAVNGTTLQVQAKQAALSKLNASLMDISVLYGDYAEEFSLPECKLAIIHCANHNDPDLVEKLWDEIINSEFDSTRNLVASSRMQSVAQQLLWLGKQYVGHELYFPLEFLIYSLERRSCEASWGASWSTSLLSEIGVPFMTLYREYSKLSKNRDNIWAQLGKPLHLVEVNSLLFEKFIDQPNISTAVERITLTRALYESTIAYLVDLEAMDPAQLSVESLLSRFKVIQARLKRAL